LDYILSRIIYQAKAFVMSASRQQDEVATKMASITSRLDKIEKEQPKAMEELHDLLESRINGVVQILRDYLNSDDVSARFTTWTLEEVPEVESSWEDTKSNIMNALANRLREIIEHWEEDHQVFLDSRLFLLQLIEQRLNFVKEQLRNLQVAATVYDLDVPEILPADEELTTVQKCAIFYCCIFLYVVQEEISQFLSVFKLLRSLWKDGEDVYHLLRYKINKPAVMAKKSKAYLSYATDESVLKKIVNDQLKEAELYLKEVEARIPKMIEADKMLCKRLGDEKRSQKEIKDLYQPILDEASAIRGHLAVFALQDTGAADIRREELDWKENMLSRLGCGAFATVYQGKMRRQGKEQTVALKVYSDVLDSKNASLIIMEVKRLR